MSRKGSKAQDALAHLVAQALPSMHIAQEMPLSFVIQNHGYSVDEMSEELHHRFPEMYIDIFATDGTDSVAFEYQGKQHYASVGHMNATNNAVLYDQLLDEEKAWVLQRIGVPIVQVAYDDPITLDIVKHRIAEAQQEMDKLRASLVPCSTCGRLFPSDKLNNGECAYCRKHQPEYDELNAEHEEEHNVVHAADNKQDWQNSGRAYGNSRKSGYKSRCYKQTAGYADSEHADETGMTSSSEQSSIRKLWYAMQYDEHSEKHEDELAGERDDRLDACSGKAHGKTGSNAYGNGIKQTAGRAGRMRYDKPDRNSEQYARYRQEMADRRRAAREQYRQSPEYAERKEMMKQARRERYLEIKRLRKQDGNKGNN